MWARALFLLIGSAGLLIGLLVIAMSVSSNHTDTLLRAQLEAPDAVLWRSGAVEIDAAAAWQPWNADAQDSAARWYQIGAEFPDLAPAQRLQHWRRAETYLQRSAALRPHAAQTFFNLARVQFAIEPIPGVGKNSWRVALALALKLNLRGAQLQVDLLQFRRQIERHLEGELLREVQLSLAQGFKDRPDEMVRMAARLGRSDWLCVDLPRNTLNENQILNCQQYGSKP
jgi:hypothetical protein